MLLIDSSEQQLQKLYVSSSNERHRKEALLNPLKALSREFCLSSCRFLLQLSRFCFNFWLLLQLCFNFCRFASAESTIFIELAKIDFVTFSNQSSIMSGYSRDHISTGLQQMKGVMSGAITSTMDPGMGADVLSCHPVGEQILRRPRSMVQLLVS